MGFGSIFRAAKQGIIQNSANFENLNLVPAEMS